MEMLIEKRACIVQLPVNTTTKNNKRKRGEEDQFCYDNIDSNDAPQRSPIKKLKLTRSITADEEKSCSSLIATDNEKPWLPLETWNDVLNLLSLEEFVEQRYNECCKYFYTHIATRKSKLTKDCIPKLLKGITAMEHQDVMKNYHFSSTAKYYDEKFVNLLYNPVDKKRKKHDEQEDTEQSSTILGCMTLLSIKLPFSGDNGMLYCIIKKSDHSRSLRTPILSGIYKNPITVYKYCPDGIDSYLVKKKMTSFMTTNDNKDSNAVGDYAETTCTITKRKKYIFSTYERTSKTVPRLPGNKGKIEIKKHVVLNNVEEEQLLNLYNSRVKWSEIMKVKKEEEGKEDIDKLYYKGTMYKYKRIILRSNSKILSPLTKTAPCDALDIISISCGGGVNDKQLLIDTRTGRFYGGTNIDMKLIMKLINIQGTSSFKKTTELRLLNLCFPQDIIKLLVASLNWSLYNHTLWFFGNILDHGGYCNDKNNTFSKLPMNILHSMNLNTKQIKTLPYVQKATNILLDQLNLVTTEEIVERLDSKIFDTWEWTQRELTKNILIECTLHINKDSLHTTIFDKIQVSKKCCLSIHKSTGRILYQGVTQSLRGRTQRHSKGSELFMTVQAASQTKSVYQNTIKNLKEELFDNHGVLK